MNVKASTQNYYFTYEIGENNIGHWVNEDPAMPDSGSYFFYVDNGMVYYVPELEAIPLIMNKAFGLALKPEVLGVFISNYLRDRVITSPISAVTNGTTSVGITVENLANLPVIGTTINIPQDKEIQLPSSYVNNIYNYYNEWVEDNGYDLPDYINIETRPAEFYMNKFDLNNTQSLAQKNFISNEQYCYVPFKYNSGSMTYSVPDGAYYIAGDADEKYLIAYNADNYRGYCETHGLTQEDSTVHFVDMMLSSALVRITCKVFDNVLTDDHFSRVSFSTDGTYTISNTNEIRQYEFSVDRLPCSNMEYLTIYKDSSILNQFANETYAPISFVSNEYLTFSTDNDNTVTTTVQQISNSTETNETIYNQSSESFTEYYTENNYHVDNSVTIENNTQIFNTYYGDSSGDGGDGGDGGNGGGEIIVPDVDFGYLKVITDILAEFLKGVQDLNEMIIETIHSITLSFGGITTLFQSVFGWLPEPILGLMIIGLGLALLGSFITWFR